MSIADTLTYPTASALRDCLRLQAIDTIIGRVVSAVVRYGGPGAATMDGCDCDGTDVDDLPATGTAYVRVAQVAAADLTGLSAQQRAGAVRQQRCGKVWVITYELGIMRCYPTTSDGTPLPATEVDVQAQRFLSDQAAIMRAINCCAYLDKHAGVEFVSMTPSGPSGGCAGAVATIRVQQARG
jgi:hypothetical protein